MGNDPSYTKQKFKVIGSRVKRPDGIDKVTGRAKYGADYNAPGQLVGLFLRSPHAHARIVKISTSRAEKLSGVKAIITSEMTYPPSAQSMSRMSAPARVWPNSPQSISL